jgi:hypothetical protein
MIPILPPAPPITGYRKLDALDVDYINTLKASGQSLLDLFAALDQRVPSETAISGYVVDPRWISIAKTHLQQAVMAAVRAVAQPVGV